MRLAPMLAVPGTPDDVRDGHAHEFKWDGVRTLVVVADGIVTVRSRRGRDVTATYPELADPELADLSGLGDAVLDGEIVALEDGRPSFERLQPRMGVADPDRARRLARSTPVALLAFDLLRVDDRELLAEPYEARRDALAELDPTGPRVQVPPAHDDVDAALAVAAELGLEGVVSKRLGSPYRPGERSPDWRKIRLVRRQELVVGGWRPERGGRGAGGRERIGSLLVGYHDADGRLVYAGAVGSGLTEAMRDRLASRLRERPTSPFAGPVPHADARFVEPQVVVEVRFREWTSDGVLRQPSVKGLRDDKDPAEVVREVG